MSETAKRIASAVVALPVYLYGFATDQFQYIPILVISTIISLGCLWEYYQIAGKDEKRKPFIAVGMIVGTLVNIIMYLYAFGKVLGYSAYIQNFDARVLLAILTLGLAALVTLQIFKRPIEGGIYSLAVTVFGVIFLVFSFSHIILLKSLRDGFYYILILNAAVMLNDTFAYFGGVNFGKHKAGFAVSPNKSWEGYFSGLLGTVLAMILFSQGIEAFAGKELFTTIEATLLGIALSVIGNIGDLAESAIKRDGAIKDSGSLIPGHGGFWDVFDALVLTMPLFYYYLVLTGAQ